jgi:hypothetical protein
MIADIPAEIRTRNFPNTCQKRSLLRQLGRRGDIGQEGFSGRNYKAQFHVARISSSTGLLLLLLSFILFSLTPYDYKTRSVYVEFV